MLLPAVKLQGLQLKTHFQILRPLSLLSALPQSDHQNDTVLRVSTLIKKPSWQNNTYLKYLVSHLNPHSVSQIIAFHRYDIPLSVKFFKWVCKQSTYCYDIDSRIHLLYLLLTNNLYGLVHKVLVFLIKECCSSEADILKVMSAVTDIRRNNGFCINYPGYSAILTCLMKLEMGLMAFSVFKSMVNDGFVAGVVDYRTIVNALCKNGFVQAAEMFISKLLKLAIALDVYVCTSLVLGNCRAGDVIEAYRVFELMSRQDGCGVNSVTYSILIHSLCEEGRLDEACKLKDDMSGRGCQPTVRTYTVLLKAMCDKGLAKLALSLFDEMITKGCKPNVHTYTVMVDMLCRKGKIEEANGMFRKMINHGLSPSAVTYNALINGYCKEGRLISAFELLGVMERRHCEPNIRTYNELIEGLCKINQPFKAFVLLSKVINNGLLPTEVTLNILIDGFGSVGHLNMAFKILCSMNSIGIDPDRFSYTSLIDKLCKMGKLQQASILLGVMVTKGVSLDEVTFTALIHGYCKIGKVNYGFMLFERMIKDRCLTSPHTFNICLDIFSKEVKLAEENALFGKMIKYGLVPSVVTYTTLVDGLSRSGDISSSLKMLEKMKQVGCRPNVYTYSIVINGLCWCGKIDRAENLLLEMQKDEVSANHIIYGSLIKSHVGAGRLYRGFEILSTMFENGCQPTNRIYIALLAGILMFDKRGSSSGENSIAILHGESSNDSFIFNEMNINHAIQLRDKVEECGGNPLDVYNFVIRGLSRIERISDADNLIQEMVKHGLFPDCDACACIIEHFCRIHDFDLCLEWIEKFLSYGCTLPFTSYTTVIVGLQNKGKCQEAEWVKSKLVKNAGVEDYNVIAPYIDFLVKVEEPFKCLELLYFIEQKGYNERPII